MTTKACFFKGVFTALVTPFDSKGHLDLDAFKNLVTKQQEASGIIVGGSTGESASLASKELALLVKTAKEVAPKLTVIASTGSNNTQKALKKQKVAEENGADAHLSVAPFYNKPTELGLVKHFSALSKNAQKPLILYNVPSRCGISLKADLVKALALEEENIAGIKQADGDLTKLQSLIKIKEHRCDFAILSGEDDAFLPFLHSGADGIISVMSHLALFEMNAIMSSYHGDLSKYAEKIWLKLLPLSKLLFSHSNPIPIKAILAHLGLIEKHFRLPLCSLETSLESSLLAEFKDFSFLKFLKELS